MEKISRRRLIEDSLALLAVAAAPAASLASSAPVGRRRVSPNEKLNVAVIGFNGRGMNHVTEWLDMADANLVAVCDCDTAVFPNALKAAEKAGKPAPATIQDVRKLLERKDIDAVSIATPNHWHALGAIWAMQAGKDVYVEKPVSHNVWEGRKIVEAARKTGKICQTGTQSRSSQGLKDAMAFLREGGLGKISLARGLCYKRRPSIGTCGNPQNPPSTVDYDLWLGPAPKRPVMRTRFHYDWHWQWDYGNGDLGNQGIHQMDIARWALGKSTLPNSTVSLGGRFGYTDDGETANTQLVLHEYDDCKLLFEVRGLETPDLRGAKIGVLVYGTEGLMVIPDYASATVFDNSGNKVKEFKAGGDHFRNFVQAVRSRLVGDLNADIEEGHYSSAMCHLGNISYRLGTPAPFNSKTGTFGDQKEISEAFGRMEEHLRANAVPVDAATYRLGRKLSINPKKERFKRDAEADGMLARDYRASFAVPEKV